MIRMWITYDQGRYEFWKSKPKWDETDKFGWTTPEGRLSVMCELDFESMYLKEFHISKHEPKQIEIKLNEIS